MGGYQGWASAAQAGWWSSFFFWASIVSLIGLGIAEVASHRYSERKDELAAQVEAEAQRRHDEDIARLQHETAQADERAANTEREAARLRLELDREMQKRKPRSLSDDQKIAMLDELRAFGSAAPVRN